MLDRVQERVVNISDPQRLFSPFHVDVKSVALMNIVMVNTKDMQP